MRRKLTIRRLLNIEAAASLLLGASIFIVWETRIHVASFLWRLVLLIVVNLLVAPFLTAVTMTVVTLWYMRQRKREPPFCSVCSYNLTGNTSGTCPECGTKIVGKA